MVDFRRYGRYALALGAAALVGLTAPLWYPLGGLLLGLGAGTAMLLYSHPLIPIAASAFAAGSAVYGRSN